MQPVRVLHVVSIMDPGGIETLLMNLFRAIDRSMIQFDFLVQREQKGFFEDEIESYGGLIYRVPYVSKVGPWKYKKLLTGFFKAHPEYQIVHSHLNTVSGLVLEAAKKAGVPVRIAHSHSSSPETGFLEGLFKNLYCKSKIPRVATLRNCDGVIGRASALGNMAIASAKKLGKPYVREVVRCSFEALWYHGSWLGKLYAPYSFLRARRLTREAPYVVYVTESFLQKRYPTRGKWINCSNVELDDFDDKILERRLRRIDSKTDGEPLILGTIGAVHVRYKGQEGVIRALAKLRQIGLDGFRYEIVGGGDQSYLRKIARKYGVADQVDFLGRITRKEVFQWLDKIDLYIQPSKTEGLPRALIEAMSRGLPCLGTRVGGIPELLTDECLFSRRKTAQALVARLSGLSKDWMKQQAKRNFMESQEYAREAFETRRREFLEQFVSSITACGDSCPSNK